MASSKKQTIGYKYFATMHMVLCHGQIDSIKQIVVGDNKNLLKGEFGHGTVIVKEESLFGGDKSGGGIHGAIDIMDGSYSQDKNEKIVEFQGELDSEDYVPAYRGVASIFLRGLKGQKKKGFGMSSIFEGLGSSSDRDGMYLGTSSYIKTFKNLIQRIKKQKGGTEDQWYIEKSAINSLGSLEVKGFDFRFSNSDADLHQWAEGSYDAESGLYKYKREDGITSESLFVQWGSSHYNKLYSYISLNINDLDEDIEEQWIVGKLRISEASIGFSSYDIPQGVSISKEYREGGYLCFNLLIPVRESDFVFKVYSSSPVNSIDYDLSILEVVSQSLLDMNPVHIVRECLVDPIWGLGEPEIMIDENSFKKSADICFDEGFGISIVWSREGSIEDFIGEILRHIQGFLYLEPKTDKYVIKLARDDYQDQDVEVLSDENILKVENYEKSVFSELVNTLTLTYTNLTHNKNSTITVQDTALVAMMGEVRSESVEYKGITGSMTAGRVAMRDLRSLATPLVSCTAIVKKSFGLSIRQGDVLSVYWSKYHINGLKMRVKSIDYGDSKNNEISIDLTEDIYSLPDDSVITTEETFIDTPKQLEKVKNQISFEAPFIELVRASTQVDVENQLSKSPFIGRLGVAAEKPSDSITFGTLWEKDEVSLEFSQSIDFDFCPTFDLPEDLDFYQSEIIIEKYVDLDDIEKFPVFAQVDDELISIESVEDILENNKILKKIIFKRGILDTQVSPHFSGGKAYVWDFSFGMSSSEYVQGEKIQAKITSATVSASTEVDDAKAMNLLINSRASRPYPPQNVTFDSRYFPEQIVGDTLDISWSHRNRLEQTGDTYISWYDGDVTKENGVTYVVDIYVNLSLIISESTSENSISLDTSTISEGSRLDVTIKSIRDTLECEKPFTWSISKTSGVARPINLRGTIL